MQVINCFNKIREIVVNAYPLRGLDFHNTEAKRIYENVKATPDDKLKAQAFECKHKKLQEKINRITVVLCQSL